PDVQTVKDFQVVVGPSAGVRPKVVMSGNEAVDTELLPVTVELWDQYRPNEPYDPETMGEWQVRLISQRNYGDTQPLTDWVAAEGGRAEFEINLQGLNTSALRVVAEASLQSPLDGYERIETSNVPYFVTVLRGGAIDANVV